MTYEFELAAAWPDVVPVARRELLGFRLSAETIEDLIQEAATVVLRKRPAFESGTDLAPYVRIVVRRLALHWLRDHRRESVGPVPDRPVLHAVPDVVEGRMLLTGTVHAYRALQPGQQALLSEYVAQRTDRAAERAADRRAGARERKQVQRLRMAMARVADGFAAALGWLRLRFPWLEALPAPTIALGFALSAMVGALIPPSHASGPPEAVTAGAAAGVGVQEHRPAVGGGASSVTPMSSLGSRPDGAPAEAPSGVVSPERRPVEVLRVEPPVGPGAGWERRPNSPDKGWVCVTVGDDATCVPKVLFPTVPPGPSLP